MPVTTSSRISVKTATTSNSEIDWDEVCKAAFPVLLPIGITGLGWYLYSQKKEQHAWIEKLKKPNWVITCPKKMALIDLIVVSPVGYAAHLVCKEATGNDRTVALSLYGASWLACVAGLSAVLNTKNLNCWFAVQTLSATLFGATAFAFYKRDRTAGLLLVPLTAWLAYGSLSMAATIRSNPTPP